MIVFRDKIFISLNRRVVDNSTWELKSLNHIRRGGN